MRINFGAISDTHALSSSRVHHTETYYSNVVAVLPLLEFCHNSLEEIFTKCKMKLPQAVFDGFVMI
jgi:hypothetical protein